MTSSTNQKITASSTGRFSPGDFYADSTLYWISLTPRVWSWNYIFFEVICFWGGGRIVTWLMSSEVFREGLTADQPVNWDFHSADAPERWPAQSHGAFFFLSSLCGKSLRDIHWRQLLPLYHSRVMSSIRFHWTVSSSVVQWSGFKVHRRQPRWKSAPPSLSLLGGGRWRAAALVNSADVVCVSSAHR